MKYVHQHKQLRIAFPTSYNHEVEEDQVVERTLQALQKTIDKFVELEGNAVGSLLSGGYDSRLLTSIASNITTDVKAYTLDFMEDGIEITNTRKVTANLGITHHNHGSSG